MRIDSNGSTSNRIATERSSKAESARSRQTETTDHASFAADSVAITSLKTRALETPPIRQERVEALRAAVRNGEYRLEPDKMADAMLNEMGEE